MKIIKRFIIILCVTFLSMTVYTVDCYAAPSISISLGQSQVAVGNTIYVTTTAPSNADKWTYRISYSENLSLERGDIYVDGYTAAGSSRSNQLMFKAKSVGTATIKIETAEIGVGNQEFIIKEGTADKSSASFSIVAVSNPTPTPTKPSGGSDGSGGSGGSGTTKPTPTPPKDTRSSNNSLASLTLSEGTLSPAFDSSVTSYSVNLSSKTSSVKVDATPSDSKATVNGTGNIEVKPGANTISVVVTAEDGTKKTYTITANVDEAPLVYTKFEDKSLGVVRNLRDVSIPAGFTETTATLEGQEVKAWKNEASGITLLYLVDEEEKAAFYVYSPDKGVVCQYMTLQFNGQTYTFAGIDESLREQEGLAYGKIDAFDKTIDGFTYKDESLSSFAVLYLMNGNNEYGYYNYDKTNQTLQQFSGAVYSVKQAKTMEDDKLVLEKKLKDEVLIRNICIGAALAFMAVSAALVFKLNSNEKKLRRIRRRAGSSDIQS